MDSIYPNGGDRLQWIATFTMISDCLTKSMTPDFMIRVLSECMYKVRKRHCLEFSRECPVQTLFCIYPV